MSNSELGRDSLPDLDGCLIGQAIGDLMGLPYENLSPRRIAKLARFDRPSFFLGYGCGSDDTEHLGLTADAIRYADGDVERFRQRLAANLRRWFLAGPPGIGLATLKACLKLCLGFSSTRSGVHSAGNGPAMRATVIGVMVPVQQQLEFVTASTLMTHTDQRAVVGSLVVARLAAEAKQLNPEQGREWIRSICDEYRDHPKLEPLLTNLQQAADALEQGHSVTEFAKQLCGQRGVSGFIAHTVPVAVFAFFRHADQYAEGIEEVIRAGGDTDTVAAITGGLIGARVGLAGIPTEWQRRHCDWPWTRSRLLAHRRPSLLLWPLFVLRNLAFFLIVLVHLFRRLLPPW